MRRRRLFAAGLFLLVLLAAGAFSGWKWFQAQLAPMPAGPPELVRYPKGGALKTVLADLQRRGLIRNADVTNYYARYNNKARPVETGTFELKPGMTADEVLDALRKPLRQMVRLPEGWWIARSARILEEKNVCSAADYIALTKEPGKFKDAVSFSLPKDSLEGYLFPDTYDLPPLLGAEETIRRQLQTFERKVVKQLPPKADLDRLVVIGSLIEAEVAADSERPLVAGIIENRLKKKMLLQIDATVLYALQEWKELPPGYVKTVQSPYNTYLHSGLPPGPIGSPGQKSLEAAAKPKPNPYLYYVALPNRTHLFAADYAGHLTNIRKRQAALRAAQ